MRKKPDFETNPWPTISEGAKDFVKKLLVKEPRARLTAAQALCMWFFIAIFFGFCYIYWSEVGVLQHTHGWEKEVRLQRFQ